MLQLFTRPTNANDTKAIITRSVENQQLVPEDEKRLAPVLHHKFEDLFWLERCVTQLYEFVDSTT